MDESGEMNYAAHDDVFLNSFFWMDFCSDKKNKTHPMLPIMLNPVDTGRATFIFSPDSMKS